MATELVVNSPTPGSRVGLTTLAASVDNAATSITVVAAVPTSGPASGLQGSGQFRIVVDSEIMIVTAGQTGTSWTVTRGAEGSTAASHSSGASVLHDLTAGALQALLSGVSGSLAADTDVSLSSPVDGDVLTYSANDDKWENRSLSVSASASGPGGTPGGTLNADLTITTMPDAWVALQDGTAPATVRTITLPTPVTGADAGGGSLFAFKQPSSGGAVAPTFAGPTVNFRHSDGSLQSTPETWNTGANEWNFCSFVNLGTDGTWTVDGTQAGGSSATIYQPANSSDFWLPSVNGKKAKIATLGRNALVGNGAPLTSAKLFLFGLPYPLRAGVPYTGIGVLAGTTALTVGTGGSNQWFTVVDAASLKTLRSTADDTVTAWAANAVKGLPFARPVADAAITAGTNTLTSATAAFTPADTGQDVIVLGAGASGAPLGSSAARVLMTYVNATTVTLTNAADGTAAKASTTVSGAVAYIGTLLVPTQDTWVYKGIMVNAGSGGTPPSMVQASSIASLASLSPPYVGNSSAGQTAPLADGTTVSAPTPTGAGAPWDIPYAFVY